VREGARRLLEAGVAGRVFPGASAAIRLPGVEAPLSACAGRLAARQPLVDEGTLYDLGDLTQIFTMVTALRLSEAGQLDLDAKLEGLLPDIRVGEIGEATLAELLLHRAGFAAWGGLYLDVPNEPGTQAARRWILIEACRRREPGARGRCVVGDLSYLAAGEAISRHLGRPLEELVCEQVTRPLGLETEVRYLAALPLETRAPLVLRTAPTERCDWRGKIIQGAPFDENCAALGGVAGHAGLFATARALSSLGAALLDSARALPNPSQGPRSSAGPAAAGPKATPFLGAASMTRMLRDHDGDPQRMAMRLKQEDDPMGRRVGPTALGAFGHTGASLVVDPEQEIVIALLTNRVHPSRSNSKIDGFRPAFHDGILAAIG